MTVSENINDETKLLEICSVLASASKLKPIILQLNDPMPQVFKDCVKKYPDIDALGPSKEETKLVTYRSNAKTYIANKIHANMKTQIKTHFFRRLKAFIRPQIQDCPYKAIEYLFRRTACKSAADKEVIDNIVQRLLKDGLMKKGVP